MPFAGVEEPGKATIIPEILPQMSQQRDNNYLAERINSNTCICFERTSPNRILDGLFSLRKPVLRAEAVKGELTPL